MGTAFGFFGQPAEEREAGLDAEIDRQERLERPFLLRYGGRIAGRFATADAAGEEAERLGRLAAKRGEVPKAFEVTAQR